MAKILFDSIAEGMIRYFVRPNDDFILNSLEKLNCDEYLYRLLKADGYERVIFFEVDKVKCRIYAYDKLSHLSIMNPNEFDLVDLENEGSLVEFYKKVIEKKEKSSAGPAGLNMATLSKNETKIDIKEYGKREVRDFSRSDDFISVFTNHISRALESEKVKTAVVMQMEIFKQILNKETGIASKTASRFVDIIRNLEKNNRAKRNVIVFTTTQASSFNSLLNESLLHDLHSWIPEILKYPTSRERLEETVKLLTEYNCLVLADSIGVDEIANLLLRKKIIEKDPRLSFVNVSKIYSVAEALQKHITRKQAIFPNNIIPYQKRKEFIRPLNALLKRDKVVDEIIKYANKAKSRELIDFSEGTILGSVYVERVTHVHTEYTKNESRDEIMSEFDELIGMDDLKRQVLKVLAKFKRDRSRYDQAVSQGKKPRKIPYMNMIFTGPPGTGKTTVADIVARLFFAEGILTKPEPMFRKPGDYSTGGRADVLGGILGRDLDEGNGGVVVIDEFYNFNRGHSAGNLANEAFSVIMDRTDNYKETMCLILAGYEKEMDEMFTEFNPGAERRFPYEIKFKSYSTDNLIEMFKIMVDDITVSESTLVIVRKIIEAEKTSQGGAFGNAGFIQDKLIPRIDAEYIDRGDLDGEFTEADIMNAFPEYASILSEIDASANEIMSEFDELIGMENIKDQVLKIINLFKYKRAEFDKALAGGKKVSNYPYMNMIFEGPPGTGKTTVADMVARLFCAEGILTKPEPISRKPSDYSTGGRADVLGGILGKDLDKANGGVFVLDEFYNFNRGHSAGNLADEAFSVIMDRTDKYKETMCLVLAGYEKEMDEMFTEFNPGAKRRFPYTITFESYSTDTLVEMFKKMVGDKVLSEASLEMVRKIIEAEKINQGGNFGNAGFIQDILIPRIEKEYVYREESDNEFTEADVMNAFPEYASILSETDESVNDIMSEFDELIGMENIKDQVLKIINLFKYKRTEFDKACVEGKKAPNYPYMNMLFEGPPGTGKTTVASIVARLFCVEGILTKTEPMSKKPADYSTGGLVDVLGGILGKDLDKGNGGVFVIDEFYNFNRGHSAGNLVDEAFSVIMDRTDKYKETMCLILAGYEKEMDEMFTKFNPGAKRRFPYTITFESYSTDALVEMFKKMVGDKVLGEATLEMVSEIINNEKARTGKNFGNAGFIQDTLIPRIEAEYIYRGERDNEFTEDDIKRAFSDFDRKVKEKKEYIKLPSSLFNQLQKQYPIKEYLDTELPLVTESSVLFIKTNKGAGTGFLISSEGYALTCNHVIEGVTDINARLRIHDRPGGSDTFHKCTVINTKKELDIAIIKLEGSQFPYLNLASPERVINRGEHIMLSGYPFGEKTEKDITTFYGRNSSSDLQTDGYGLIRYNINCEAKSGNSGAPVISLSDGQVIGILLGSITESSSELTEEINYMRPIKYFWEEFLL